MLPIFLKTLPFFALIGLGYGAAATRFFAEEATAWLTKFVFYFALPAMLFRFSSGIDLGTAFEPSFMLAYLCATLAAYALAFGVALARGTGWAEASVEAQCGAIGNVGFLGLPMLALLLGAASVGPIIMVLAVDLIVFGSLIVIVITVSRGGGKGARVVLAALRGLASNPMIVAIASGLAWSSTGLGLAQPVAEFVEILGAAATPCALFVIGASLASKSAERVSVAVWLSAVKLVVHPAAAAVAALVLWPVDRYAAGVMIASAAMPTAGNVFIIAQAYGVAPMRVSSTILVSTVASVVTLTAVIAWVATF